LRRAERRALADDAPRNRMAAKGAGEDIAAETLDN
jgi:hypothetical protein